MKTLFLFLLIATTGKAQKLENLIKALESKSYEKVDFLLNPEKREKPKASDSGIVWTNLGGPDISDFFDDYDFGIFYLTDQLPKVQKEITEEKSYCLKLVKQNDSIIYYNITVNNANTNKKIIKTFKNNAGWDLMQKKYFEKFSTTLPIVDLFREDFVYGTHCGFVGTKTSELDQLEDWVKARNVKAIYNWLISPCLEKQLYALRGYRLLQYYGYTFSFKEEEYIEFLKNKDGKVNTCGGCIFGEQSFNAVASQIFSDSIVFLLPDKRKPQTYKVVPFTIQEKTEIEKVPVVQIEQNENEVMQISNLKNQNKYAIQEKSSKNKYATYLILFSALVIGLLVTVVYNKNKI
jgi:hypothetical protein